MILAAVVVLSKLSDEDANRGGQGSIFVSFTKDIAFMEETMSAITVIISILAGWALMILPAKAASLNSPGFIFGNTWVLYHIRDYLGFIPNLPCRICETRMGRLSLRELAIILPIHFLVPAATFWVLQLLLPTTAFTSDYAVEPVIYSERNPWIIDFVRETFVNALFTVGLLVIPELLRINGIRRGYAILLLYPLYSFSVDAGGKASVFGPNIIYSLRTVSKHGEVPLKNLSASELSHQFGSVVGGIIGGGIMQTAFPDDNKAPARTA